MNNTKNFTYKTIHINDIILDNQNPRLPEIKDNESECIKEIIKNPNKKFFSLLEDICENGLNPGEDFYLIPADSKDKYIVAEGNRRICSLKLLHNPLIVINILSKKQISRLINISNHFKLDPINSVRSVIFNNRDEADPWIVRKHQGENGGIGIVPWGSPEKNRYNERSKQFLSLSTQIIDYFVNNKTITDIESKEISITNLNRIAEKSLVKSLLNFNYENKKLKIIDDKNIFEVVFGQIIKMLTQGIIKVSDIYTETLVISFIYEKVIPLIQKSADQKTIEIVNAHFKSKVIWVNSNIRNKPEIPIVFPQIRENLNRGEEKILASGETSQNEDNAKSKLPEAILFDEQVGIYDQSKLTPSSDTSQSVTENVEEDEGLKLNKIEKNYNDTFEILKKLIVNSKLENDLKKIVRQDISEAHLAYGATAWKACASMIGAILEGVMLGTLLRVDVLNYVVENKISKVMGKEKNLYDPALTDHRSRILQSNGDKNISYDILKQFITEIIPQRKDFDPTTIQHFRNIIHPAVSLKDKNIKLNQPRANSLLADCRLLVEEIINYEPPKSGQK